jgi:hypothetical protein
MSWDAAAAHGVMAIPFASHGHTKMIHVIWPMHLTLSKIYLQNALLGV